jgi:hypothetical protein
MTRIRGTPLTPADYAALERRWIDRDLADAAMLRRVDHFEGSDILGRNGGGRYEGLCIPYFWPGENRVREYRIRRDHPEYENEKPKGKYMSPPGKSNILYFGPGVDVDWLADVQFPIVLTEGEFKCLALQRAAYHGLADGAERPRFLPVALSGVWNFRGTIGKVSDASGARVDEKGPITDLSRLEWSGRSVIIAFDLDVKKNESVQIARATLTRELQKRGAEVRWFGWPKKIPEGVKGVDDFLAAVGPERVLELIESSIAQRPQRYAGADDGRSRKFICDDTGVWAEPQSRESKLRFISRPLWIVARTADYNGNCWGKQVSFLDPHGKTKRLIISNAELLGDKNEAIQRLVDAGFEPRYD